MPLLLTVANHMIKVRFPRVLSMLSLVLFIACGGKENEIEVQAIALSQPSAEMEIGETLTLKANVSPSNATYDGITWTSTNPKVASVTNSGLVSAMSEGNTTITVMAGGKTANCSITVVKGFVAVSFISLENTSLEMVEGVSETLSVVVLPDDATDKTVTWTSSNKDVAVVDNNGVVIAINPGETTITAKAGDQTALCKVTVKALQLELKPAVADILVGDEMDIAARVTPESANVSITWTSSNSDLVSVDGSGHIIALATGDAVICATTEIGKTAFCNVHVRNSVESVSLTAPSETCLEGASMQLEVVVTPEGSPDTSITWSSSDPSIAGVDNNGLVTAKKKGKVTITVTVQNGAQTVSESCEIQVIPPITSITVSPASLEMFVDDVLEISKILTITTEPADDDDPSYKYSTSSAGIISVSQGTITGMKAGTVTLYIVPSKGNPNNLRAECKITVKAKVASVTVAPSSYTMQVGQTYMLKTTVSPSIANQEVVWSTSDAKVATVENGKVTALQTGEAVITATSKDNPEIKGTCVISVVNTSVESVELNKTKLTLVEGSTEILTATVKPDNAHEKTVSWTSSNKSVATVSSAGKITAVKAGTATITASCGGKEATCVVTVNAVVTSITLPATDITLEYGNTYDLSAVTILPKDAADKSLEWSSSNTKIASVTNGIVKAGTTSGTATITVKSKSNPKVSATCKVTVKAQVILVSKITISPIKLDLYVNQTKKATAEISPSNADNTGFTWSVSQGGIITVDQDGNVTGAKAGTARLIATSDDGNSMAFIVVTVIKNEVASVTLNVNDLQMKVGETYDLLATVMGEDSSAPVSVPMVKWSSSSTSVATVSSSGQVMAKKAGTATIMVTSIDNPTMKSTCKVTVLPEDTDSPKGYKVFIKHGAEFKYDNIPGYGTSQGSAFTSPNTKYNYSGDNHELWVSMNSTEGNNMLKELGMSLGQFYNNYNLDEPVLFVKKNTAGSFVDPGDLADTGNSDSFYQVSISDLNLVYGYGLTLSKLAPSNWADTDLEISLILDPAVSLGGPHFVYVVFKALDNDKHVDVVVKFVYNVR